MSKSHSESLISRSLPIEELVRLIKHSFSENEFNEVQNILVDREKNMRIEMENFMRDNDMIKKEVCLLEKTQGLVELAKSKLEEKLQMSQKKCEDLNEKITRLIEEQRVSNDRVKQAEERYDKLSEENFRLAREKNKIIFELNEKINELKNKNLENKRLVGVYEEKTKSLDARVLIMSQEIENLKNKYLEANRTVDELRLQKLESDKEAELYKSRLKSLEPRIVKLEAALAEILNVKPGDLPSIVDEMEKRTAAKGRSVNILEFTSNKDNLGNERTENGGHDDSEIALMSPRLRFTCNSTGNGNIGLSKKGDGILDQSSGMKWNAAKTIKINPSSQSGYNTSPTEGKDDDLDNGPKGLQNPGKHASSRSSDRTPTKTALAAGNIIEICDSDDETIPSGEAFIKIGTNVGKNKTVSREFASSKRTTKRNNSDSSDNSFILLKRKRSICRSNEPDSPIDDNDIQLLESTTVQNFNALNNDNLSDSDNESYSDEHMNNLVASLRSRKKWMSKADMLQAFQNDEQLCMNAVCALYRRQLSAKTGGFSHSDLISGSLLAEYLTGRDPELKLRKSVDEVKNERPDALRQCKRLATKYYEKLYEIYRVGDEPFFC